MTFREAIDLSVKADGSKEYPAKFTIEVEGKPWHCHTVAIAHRDILCFCDKGTATFLVDSYGDRHVAELFNWEISK